VQDKESRIELEKQANCKDNVARPWVDIVTKYTAHIILQLQHINVFFDTIKCFIFFCSRLYIYISVTGR